MAQQTLKMQIYFVYECETEKTVSAIIGDYRVFFLLSQE